MEWYHIRGHAATPKGKRAVMMALLESWDCCPELRLGQLLSSAVYALRKDLRDDIGGASNADLIEGAAKFVRDAIVVGEELEP